MKRTKKIKGVELDLHQCKPTAPFEFKEDYHYYNPPIYSMGGVYFKGHNLRQMKRYTYILWRLAYGYENLYKHRLLYGPNKKIDNMLAITRDLCVHAHKVYMDLSTWPAESPYSKDSNRVFASYCADKMHMHLTVEQREDRMKKMKYIRNLDKWGHETKEIKTKADFKKYWVSFTSVFYDEARLFTSWGHWLTFLFIADLESGEDTGLDLTNLDALIQKGKKFDEQLNEFRLK